MVFAARAQQFGLPSHVFEEAAERPRMAAVEPDRGDVNSAADQIFDDARLVHVVSPKSHLPPGDLARPGISGQERRIERCRRRIAVIGYWSEVRQQLLDSGNAQAPE